MDWMCPKCKHALAAWAGGLHCRACRSNYETVAGIPDLRIDCETWIDHAADRRQAWKMTGEIEGMTAAQAVRHVFSSRPDWKESQIELRTSEVIDAPKRYQKEIKGWLQQAATCAGPFLDLGCGPGTLLAAAAAEGRMGIGIDVSMVWLVVARKVIEESGGRVVLAAACGEALPLADASMGGDISLDVIEHVSDQACYLREVSRVTMPGGFFACSTPNRFSLAAEPHVHVWGVGWLPHTLQNAYVKWRLGHAYLNTNLLSGPELGRLLRQHTEFRYRILTPPVPDENIARFRPYRVVLARLYNFLVTLKSTRWLWLRVAPFFHLVCKKS